MTQSTVASEFGIRQPSVSEWIKYGRIGKRHLTHLVSSPTAPRGYASRRASVADRIGNAY